MVYYQGDEGFEERFSFFILPEDDDGIENLTELYLYHDREGLRWLLTPEDWVSYRENGQTWIGSRSIAMVANETLPRGQYRAVLVNKGGESSERTFSFDAPEDPPHPFPYLEVSDGVYHITSDYPVNRFIYYDNQGYTLDTVTLSERDGLLADLKISNSVKAIALWAEDASYQSSALTDVVAIR